MYKYHLIFNATVQHLFLTQSNDLKANTGQVKWIHVTGN